MNDKLKTVKAGDPISAAQHNMIVDILRRQQTADNVFIDSTGVHIRPRARRQLIDNFAFHTQAELNQLFLAIIQEVDEDIVRGQIYQPDWSAGIPRAVNANYWITPTNVILGYCSQQDVAPMNFTTRTAIPALHPYNVVAVLGESEGSEVVIQIGVGDGIQKLWVGKMPTRPHVYAFRAFCVEPANTNNPYTMQLNRHYMRIICGDKEPPNAATDTPNSWRSILAGNVAEGIGPNTSWVDWRGEFDYSIEFEEPPPIGTLVKIAYGAEEDWKYTIIDTMQLIEGGRATTPVDVGNGWLVNDSNYKLGHGLPQDTPSTSYIMPCGAIPAIDARGHTTGWFYWDEGWVWFSPSGNAEPAWTPPY